jgi:hypothetical protein
MALQGDGSGIVTFPTITLTGDFSVSGTFTYVDATQVMIGNSASGSDFIACFSGGSVRCRIGGGDTGRIDGLSPGQAYSFTYSRVGNAITFSVVGFADFNGFNTADFNLGSFLAYNGGALKYSGRLSGVWEIEEAGVLVRSYDMEQAEGSTTLPDSENNQDGTLSGFTTGGFTAPAGAGITITSPAEFTGRKADVNGDATFTITGNCDASVTAVEVSTDNITWATLDASPTTTYSGTVTVNGQKTVYVRAANDVADTASVDGITAGVVIAAWGQSNCAGRGFNNQSYVVGAGPTPVMYRSGAFSAMQDPTGVDSIAAGSLWPLIAQRYIDDGIPVIIANVGEGGTSISQWNTIGTLYNRIVSFASAVGGLDLAISIIGETDSAGTTKADFKSDYLATATAISTNYGCDVHAVKFPVGDSTPNVTRTEIREAYDELIAENAFIKFGGDLSVVDIDTGIGEDGLHLKTDQHLSEGAAIIEAALFNEISTLNLSISGIPDGTYKTYLLDQSDNVVYNDNLLFSGGSASVTGLVVAAGTALEGYAIDNESPHVNGAVITGVTV